MLKTYLLCRTQVSRSLSPVTLKFVFWIFSLFFPVWIEYGVAFVATVFVDRRCSNDISIFDSTRNSNLSLSAMRRNSSQLFIYVNSSNVFQNIYIHQRSQNLSRTSLPLLLIRRCWHTNSEGFYCREHAGTDLCYRPRVQNRFQRFPKVLDHRLDINNSCLFSVQESLARLE